MPLSDHNAKYIPVEKYKMRLLSQRRIEGECWIWTGFKNKDGYGTIQVGEVGSPQLVHRLSMLLFAPDKFKTYLNVNHKCHNTACFNPEHLYAGTQAENMIDRTSQLECCRYGHPYTKENTLTRKNGRRECRTCVREMSRIRRKNAKSI